MGLWPWQLLPSLCTCLVGARRRHRPVHERACDTGPITGSDRRLLPPGPGPLAQSNDFKFRALVLRAEPARVEPQRRARAADVDRGGS